MKKGNIEDKLNTAVFAWYRFFLSFKKNYGCIMSPWKENLNAPITH